MTAWARAAIKDNVGGGSIITKYRYDRCFFVTHLQGGRYFIRLWRRPWKKVFVEGLIFRKTRHLEDIPDRPIVRIMKKAWRSVRVRIRNRSFVVWMYRMNRETGLKRAPSLKMALRMRSQAREWRKILKMSAHRTPRTEKKLYERLKNAPKLFD
jgi:hypothetical protein